MLEICAIYISPLCGSDYFFLNLERCKVVVGRTIIKLLISLLSRKVILFSDLVIEFLSFFLFLSILILPPQTVIFSLLPPPSFSCSPPTTLKIDLGKGRQTKSAHFLSLFLFHPQVYSSPMPTVAAPSSAPCCPWRRATGSALGDSLWRTLDWASARSRALGTRSAPSLPAATTSPGGERENDAQQPMSFKCVSYDST